MVRKRKLNHIRKVTNFLSQENGRQLERAYFSMAKVQNKEIYREPRGSDYKERNINPLTGKGVGGYTLTEVKTGRARKTKLQDKTKKKVGKGRYKEVRFGWGF